MQLIKSILPLSGLLTGTMAYYSTANTTSAPGLMYPLSADSEFAFYLAEVISMTSGGGAATGEVLRAASQIEPGNFESFYTEFRFMADAVHEMALYTNATRFPVSARDAYFRSSQYYRASDFFLHGNWSDPRLTTLWDLQLADFASAISLLDIPGERFTVKGPDFDIPGYFFPAQSQGSGNKVPTILAGTGYDGAQEELYHSVGVHVLQRGWNFATYEGPGQATVRRQQNIGFTPNWWDVVTPVVDYLSNRSDVDMSQLALLGESFGAALAPLAASREHRFKAVVCVDGLYSIQNVILEQFPDEMSQAFKAGNATLFNQMIAEAVEEGKDNIVFGTEIRWFVDQGLWAFNTEDPFTWMSELGNYTLDGIFPQVTSPVFIGDGQHDTLALTDAQAAWQALGSDNGYYWQFNTEYGAGEHCQIGSEQYMNMIVWDWVADVFEGNWATGNGTVSFY